jgi:adenosylmethionine-8-amino-7-oxononanoate aminotransferase
MFESNAHDNPLVSLPLISNFIITATKATGKSGMDQQANWDWQQQDRDHIWHPLTLTKLEPELLAVVRAKGPWLYSAAGTRVLDMISSWWVNVHGHGHPAIAAAVARQVKQLDHVIFGGVAHPAATAVVQGLRPKLPAQLSRYFFSESGAVAVEIALKQAAQYWRNLGQPQRQRFVAFDGAYHGETFGAMSVSGQLSYSQNFRDWLFAVDTIPFPETWDGDDAVEGREAAALAAADRLLDQQGNTLIALIVEPLVQGAGGMRMCRPQFLNRLVAKFQQAGVLVIFDEIMTGFGRTGRLFAHQKLEPAIVPDILCLSKGLSGGVLPLALTITQESIYQVFNAHDWQQGFAHSSSFCGNPIACAAAAASLALFDRPEAWQAMERLQAWYQEIGTVFAARYPQLVRWRRCGNILAVDLAEQPADYGSSFSVGLRQLAIQHGLLLRPLGNTLYLMPPYCLTTAQLQQAFKGLDGFFAAILN